MVRTEDGFALEAEIGLDGAPRAALVLCHPHPLHGGSMRSVVVGALFAGLRARGVACLRFNFRGVEGSEGTYGAGELERLDVEAALRHLGQGLPAGTPLALAGWSFGADVAMSVRDGTHGGWFLVAPPLKFAGDPAATGADPRPKRLALAEHDQFRAPEEVEAEVTGWSNTQVETIGGADHFFIGRTDRLVDLAAEFVDGLVPED